MSDKTTEVFEIDKRSLADQVSDHIRHLILSEELKSGERIPEEAIAQRFGVSRTPIREALRKLEKIGLVKLNPRNTAEVVSLSEDDARHIGETRYFLEAGTARLLAQHANAEDIAALREISERCRHHIEQSDLADVFETDDEFHLEIARRSGNTYMYDILRTLDVKIQLLRTTAALPRERLRENIALHAEIIDAIERHDPDEAETLMRRHVALGLGSFASET